MKYEPGDILAFLNRRWWVRRYDLKRGTYTLVPIYSLSHGGYYTDGRAIRFTIAEVEAKDQSWYLEKNLQPPRLKSAKAKKR